MATQNYPVLKISADFPELGQKDGVFEMKKATVEPLIRTGYLVENRFSPVSGALGNLAGKGSRKGVTVDTGGGQHVNEITIESLSTDNGGSDGQWGYSSDTSILDQATATGGDRIQKIQVFNRYLIYSSPDSLSPATLEYGEYHPDGVMPEGGLPVYLEDPDWTIEREQSSTFTGQVRFVSTIDLLNNAVTAKSRTG